MSDDTAVQPACQSARETITTYAKTEHNDVVLSFALEGLIEIEDGVLGNADAEQAARHIETCESCASWLDEFYPDRAEKRAAYERRQDIYCCSSMWHAVNNDEAKTKFKFIMFRGEDPCWCINDDFCFARFCPWCASPLPEGPFETVDET